MNNSCNQSIFYERPAESCIDNDMKLTRTGIITIAIYSVLFILSSFCNLSMLIFLRCKKPRESSRINKFMLHLNIANLIITFVTIPLEIGWKFTVYWRAGYFGCKFFQFLRPIGLYLASFIIISLCIDRYYAILYPMKAKASHKRTKILVFFSWAISILCAVPQIFVFSLKTHPTHKWYTQCLDFKFDTNPFENPEKFRLNEIFFLSYQIFVAVITFFLPLLVILVTYGRIIFKIISQITTERKDNREQECSQNILYSDNRNNNIKKAKKKTLKLAIIIVIAFLVCWTPYYTISVWFWIDPLSASKIDDRIYNFLFIFAVSNCLANPLVYGLTSFNFRIRTRKYIPATAIANLKIFEQSESISRSRRGLLKDPNSNVNTYYKSSFKSFATSVS